MDLDAMQFFHAGRFDYSVEQTKGIVAFTLRMLENSHRLREKKARERGVILSEFDFKKYFPAVDRILNYDKRAKCNFPKLITTQHTVMKNSQRIKVSMTLPSNIIRWLLGIKDTSKKLARYADHTPDMLIELNQGNKWKYNPYFRCPMIASSTRYDNPDMWIGDKIKSLDGVYYVFICNFVTCDEEMLIEGYEVTENEEGEVLNISDRSVMIGMKDLDFDSFEKYQYGEECIFSSAYAGPEQDIVKVSTPDSSLSDSHIVFF
jgi:hypothetical protein